MQQVFTHVHFYVAFPFGFRACCEQYSQHRSSTTWWYSPHRLGYCIPLDSGVPGEGPMRFVKTFSQIGIPLSSKEYTLINPKP